MSELHQLLVHVDKTLRFLDHPRSRARMEEPVEIYILLKEGWSSTLRQMLALIWKHGSSAALLHSCCCFARQQQHSLMPACHFPPAARAARPTEAPTVLSDELTPGSFPPFIRTRLIHTSVVFTNRKKINVFIFTWRGLFYQHSLNKWLYFILLVFKHVKL